MAITKEQFDYMEHIIFGDEVYPADYPADHPRTELAQEMFKAWAQINYPVSAREAEINQTDLKVLWQDIRAELSENPIFWVVATQYDRPESFTIQAHTLVDAVQRVLERPGYAIISISSERPDDWADWPDDWADC